MGDSLNRVVTALANWKSADEELHRVEELAAKALATGAPQSVVQELILQLADIRSHREKAYRLALAEMQQHHDRTRPAQT